MKKIHKLLVVFLACTLMFSLCACGGNGNENTPQTQTYTIQYTDNTGIHSISVQSGKLYSISSIPEKSGYEFMGLYDAETGGTQYVNSGGSSVAAFTDNQNIVLYPQFKAKEYTLVLDYQGAAVTGSRSLTVGYNSLINDLPMNLTMENKNFVGWYTQPDKQGIQVADQYGTIPSKNIVDESIFDLSDPKGYIYLYAGFKGEEFTVTFYLTESGAPEEVKVEYGTPISEVQLETRVDGKAVITWSKKRNDTNKEEVFNGKVTSEMVLYAAEYAPVIDFDSNGGNNIKSIIARAGDTINLPTPVRENYKFVGWQTASGSTFNATTMPTTSAKLTAKWQAMILFDTNGGTDVVNISEPQGTRITLPETEKAGFMFAGWYDSNGTQYTATAMPSISVKLYAKYWRIEKITKVLIDETNSYYAYYNRTTPSVDSYCKELDLSEVYNAGVRKVNITVRYQTYTDGSGTSASPAYTYVTWYSTKTASEAYKLWQFEDKHIDSNWANYTQKIQMTLPSKTLYLSFWCTGVRSSKYAYWKNFYIEIEYPDTSTLY